MAEFSVVAFALMRKSTLPPETMLLPLIESQGGVGSSLHHLYTRQTIMPLPCRSIVRYRPCPSQAPTKALNGFLTGWLTSDGGVVAAIGSAGRALSVRSACR